MVHRIARCLFRFVGRTVISLVLIFNLLTTMRILTPRYDGRMHFMEEFEQDYDRTMQRKIRMERSKNFITTLNWPTLKVNVLAVNFSTTLYYF